MGKFDDFVVEVDVKELNKLKNDTASFDGKQIYSKHIENVSFRFLPARKGDKSFVSTETHLFTDKRDGSTKLLFCRGSEENCLGCRMARYIQTLNLQGMQKLNCKKKLNYITNIVTRIKDANDVYEYENQVLSLDNKTLQNAILEVFSKGYHHPVNGKYLMFKKEKKAPHKWYVQYTDKVEPIHEDENKMKEILDKSTYLTKLNNTNSQKMIDDFEEAIMKSEYYEKMIKFEKANGLFMEVDLSTLEPKMTSEDDEDNYSETDFDGDENEEDIDAVMKRVNSELRD